MNNRQRFHLWMILSSLGLIAVLSLLFSEIPLDNLPPEVLKRISKETLRWIIMANPAILILLFTGLGVSCFDRVNFRAPLLEQIIDTSRSTNDPVSKIVLQGLLGGMLAGISIVIISKIFTPYLPAAFADDTQGPDMHLITKIMYGGVAEELMIRFGIMSGITFVLYKITHQLTAAVYILSILISSFLFALGHFPVMFQYAPDPSVFVYLYVILGNCAGGIIFGYLYWKRGLESAMIAHAVAHLTMTSLSFL